MPKMKTRRAAAKRFEVTGNGKIRRRRAFRSHLLSDKTRKRKRHLRKKALVSKADEKRVRQALPYLKK